MLLIAVFLVLAAAGAQLAADHLGLTVGGRDLHMAATGVTIDYRFDMRAAFHSHGNTLFFATRDGLQSLSVARGDVQWQQAFHFNDPILVRRGETLAIGESLGRRIYVFGPGGLRYAADFDEPVLHFSVNQAGYLATILRLGTGYEVRVHSPAHFAQPLYRRTIREANLYPVAVDVSEDGRVIALALLDVHLLMVSRVQFSYIREVDGRGFVDGLFAMENYPGELVFDLRFTRCGRALVFTDSHIIGFQLGGQHNLPEIFRIPLHNRLDKLYVGEQGFAFVTGEPDLNAAEALAEGNLHIFDMQGRPTGYYPLTRRVSHLTLGPGNAALVGMDRTFYAVSAQGVRLWTHTTYFDVRQILFLGNTDTVLIAGNHNATVMQRVRR